MSARIALATCAELPELGEDEPLLLHALRARGVAAEPAVWDYPAIDWEAYELVVGEYVIKPTISAGSRDTARYGPGDEARARAHRPDSAERIAAEEILDSLPGPRCQLLYARVDLIPGPDGAPRLVELELTEPSLFLSYEPRAADRLAEHVLERL